MSSVLDTRVKRGAELSTDHHLVVSRIHWQGRKLDRPGRPKRIVRVCWERLAEPSVREVFTSHLRESFDFDFSPHYIINLFIIDFYDTVSLHVINNPQAVQLFDLGILCSGRS